MGADSEKCTVVQHSGFGYGNKHEFARGLEVRRVAAKAEQDAVVRAGGVLFDTHQEADEFCDRAMWPGEREGFDLVPRARGTFSETKVDSLRVYLPATEVTLLKGD